MSTTRSPSPTASATDAVIVSHGSPSDPEPQEAFITALADRVAELSGRVVRGATLAQKGSLDAAVAGLDAPLIYPLFMSDGWFVSTNLQNRLKAAGLAAWTTATPLGMDPNLADMAVSRLRREMDDRGLPPGETALVLAAHGSPSDPRPARATANFAAALGTCGLFREIRPGYVDEEPALVSAATVTGPAIVLPFFAARAGHVLMDLPEALTTARFDGPVLDPIGTWPDVPRLIAQTLRSAQSADAA